MTDAQDPNLVTLAACPIGLFMCGDELCLKTEYGNNEGRIDAYIVSSGEFFWGAAPQTIASQRAQMVRPLDKVFLPEEIIAAESKGRAQAFGEAATYADSFTNAGPDDISEEPMVGRFQREIGAAIRALAEKEKRDGK